MYPSLDIELVLLIQFMAGCSNVPQGMDGAPYLENHQHIVETSFHSFAGQNEHHNAVIGKSYVMVVVFKCLSCYKGLRICLYRWQVVKKFPMVLMVCILLCAIITCKYRLFAGKWFLFGKWIPRKVNSWKMNSGKVFSDVW